MIFSNTTFRWHDQQWQYLLQRYQTGQLPHALLLTGTSGLGKLEFAKFFASWLLCDANKSNQKDIFSPPCGQCNGCSLLSAGTHPDALLIEPEAEGKAITVDSIRQIAGKLSLKSQFAALQVVIVNPADAMNKFAANSLLKTLEEPTPDSLLVLVCDRPSQLLPTIRSRCQRIEFEIPPRDVTRQWLEQANNSQNQSFSELQLDRAIHLANGAPLAAFSYLHQGLLEQYQQLLESFEKLTKKQVDVVKEAEKWTAVGLTKSMTWLYNWVSSLIRLKSSSQGVDTALVLQHKELLNNVWQEPALAELSHTLDITRLYEYLDYLTSVLRVAHSQVNVQLSMENTLIKWADVSR